MTSPLPRVDHPTGPITVLHTVLLVDDDPIQRKLIGIRLAEAGYLVETASNAAEGLERALREVPDLIVSDVLMGEVDGFGFCRQIRDNVRLRRVPVILVSSHYDTQADRVLAEQVGASALITRTADFAEALAMIERVLGEPRRARPSSGPASMERHLRSNANQLARLAGQAESAEQRYRALVENTTDVVSVIDLTGIIVEANHRWRGVLGYAPEEMIGHHIREFAATGSEDANNTTYRAAVEQGSLRSAPLPLRHRDGRRVFIEFSTTVICVDGRDLSVALGHEVTAQVESQRRLAAEEKKYRSLVESIPDVVWSASADGALTFMTANCERLFGYPAEDIIAQQPLGTGVHPDDQARVATAWSRFVAGEVPLDMEYRRLRPDGTTVWLRAIGRRNNDDGIVRFDGLCSDISAQKALEEQIRQAQKMEAIGQLSGGIAHDFNNILSVIMANSQFLIDALAEQDPRREDAEEIKRAGERAAALTRQLLAFSRRQVLEPTTVGLDTVVQGVHKMLGRLLGEDVELVVKPGVNVGMARVDVGQLEQVIMNLVVNARDAMPAGGTLTIETTNADLDELAAAQVSSPPGSYVTVSVTDTGSGMDAATRARIFEPFFTTKEQGHGTGLGLATCYGIVKQSGGAITVYSELGLGSVFRVYLPRVEKPAVRAQRQSRGPVLGGSETVLVVEDDNLVRTCVSRMLEECGYHVLSARDGDEAILLATQTGRPVDLVLSDVIMPRSSGPEVVMKINQVAPGARALYMSGYSDHAILRDGVLQDDVLHFLPKPFTRNALARKLRDVLDA